ncbi:anhydro-N-acetylmuramic acid kinase [Terasakiispira papahanaumokuakeensis]|nr:anhydro-N-acetylmuramic acid kinase [Terasakiispira papahanaumokuakeensis]
MTRTIPSTKTPCYLGLMSGTSLDGIDIVATVFEPDDTGHTVASLSQPFAPELRQALMQLASGHHSDLIQIGQTEQQLTSAYAALTQQLLERLPAQYQPVALGCHGQTIEHQPDLAIPFTWQLLDPSRLAELTGVDVIADFRRRDIAAGGQGAPLVPAFHAQHFTREEHPVAVINLGGIANVSWLPAGGRTPVLGFDTGPANMLMDAWTQRHLGQPIDWDGAWAQQGQVIPELLTRCLADEYFAREAPKSTGREYFNLEWLEQKGLNSGYKPQDVQATLLALTATSITLTLDQLDPSNSSQVILCGGGAENIALRQTLEAQLAPRQVNRSSDTGLPTQLVEATAFAWLAWRHLNRAPGNCPEVTGAKGPRILGGWYPA